jgi:superfamily II DNA or RNA helicase
MKTLNGNMMTRLHYVSSLTNVNKSTLTRYVIVDEADHVILKDLKNFAKLAKSETVKTLCLTATPDDGDADGSERKAFESLSFETFKISSAQVVPPKIHEH